VRAEVEPGRAREAVELLLGEAGLEQPLAPLGLRPARADRAHVEVAAPQRSDQRRDVEPLLVR